MTRLGIRKLMWLSLCLTGLATGPARAAPGDFQRAVDSFRNCQVHRNAFATMLLRSVAAPEADRRRWRQRLQGEIDGDIVLGIEREFKTATVRPAGPARFAGLPVSSLAATTCKDGECGMAVHEMNFDGIDAAARRRLASMANPSRRPGVRLEFVDHGARGASLVCDFST